MKKKLPKIFFVLIIIIILIKNVETLSLYNVVDIKISRIAEGSLPGIYCPNRIYSSLYKRARKFVVTKHTALNIITFLII